MSPCTNIKHLLLSDDVLEANLVVSTPVLVVAHHHPVVTCTVTVT